MLEFHPINTPEKLKAVQTAAAADGHGLVYPTLGIFKDSSVVGALSLNSVPVTMWWMKTDMNPRDSLYGIQTADNIARASGLASVIVACLESSPYYRAMTEHFGYKLLTKTALFHKSL